MDGWMNIEWTTFLGLFGRWDFKTIHFKRIVAGKKGIWWPHSLDNITTGTLSTLYHTPFNYNLSLLIMIFQVYLVPELFVLLLILTFKEYVIIITLVTFTFTLTIDGLWVKNITTFIGLLWREVPQFEWG